VDAVKTTVEIRLHRKLGEISPYIYGQYFEHVEDCIYPSVWDDQSPHANELGMRQDVIDAAVGLGVPAVRWPGGCFADVYHWEDGIGPREQRPVRRNLHWGSLESNQFGTDEFLRWCELTGAEPYLNFNIGTGTLDEALRWMDYCIGTEPTTDVLRRRANGREEPYKVKFWGIGNETWAQWEAGRMNADDYGMMLANWSEFVRKMQPEAQIMGVGSNDADDPEWDRTVLKRAGAFIDYLTLHTYSVSLNREDGREYESMAYVPVYFEQRMRKMLAVIEETAVDRGNRPIRIAMDEWNIRHCFWNEEKQHYDFRRSSPRTVQDALLTAGVLNSMIRLSPHIGMANYVFLVNGNAVMNVDEHGVVKTPLYYIFQQYRRMMLGEAIEVGVHGPTTVTPEPQINWPYYKPQDGFRAETVPYIDAAASVNGDQLAISLINRHQNADIEVELLIPAGYELISAWTLHDENVYAANDFESRNRILPEEVTITPGTTSWVCKAHSIVLLTCRKV